MILIIKFKLKLTELLWTFENGGAKCVRTHRSLLFMHISIDLTENREN